MKYYLIGMTFSFIWIAYEMYKAPQMDERGKILKPGKKVSDLFKKKEIKKTAGSYSDLERHGRGRSKY